MKKLLQLLLISIMGLTLAACGRPDEEIDCDNTNTVATGSAITVDCEE